jgi:hypothetical protein
MNPDEFLTLAIRLSNSNGEAEKRTAVSRAYYGSFHAARLFVTSCGVKCPESAEAHDKIAKCLQHCGDPSAETAGRELDSLRSTRNRADYRLNSEQFRDAAFIRLQLERAQRIHSAILNAYGIIETIRGPLREYASDILGLPLSSDG